MAQPIVPGANAPDFALPSTPDQKVSLSDFRGRPVILAFYPADWSPVCGDQVTLYTESAALLTRGLMLQPRPLLFLVPTLSLAVIACGSDPSGGDPSGGDPSGGDPSGGEGGGDPSGGSVGSICAAPVDHTGDGTFYDADGSGSCSFDPTGDLMVGAMNHVDYAGAAACGACVHIVGPSGELTVRIVDQCPECEQGDVDLSAQAFSQLADPMLGRVTIHWSYVPCDVEGPIAYHFKEGSNPWWAAVQIRNARYAIAKFEFMKDGQYVEVSRLDYNYFVADSGMGPGPYTFRVTDVEGNVLEDMAVPLAEASDSAGAQQFPVCAK
jgi:expansin (peptidoglycan-binding protein)